jgi:hypothetical protein
VAAPIDAKSMPVASEPAPSYRYTPQPGPTTNGNLAAASFSDAVTASGAATWIYKPVIQAVGQPSADRPNALPTKEQAAGIVGQIDVTLPIGDAANAILADGTQAFLPASMSANPVASAARYLRSVLEAESAGRAEQTIEAFPIGFAKASRTPVGAFTAAVDPLRGKIMAGAGPLDNSLALP